MRKVIAKTRLTNEMHEFQRLMLPNLPSKAGSGWTQIFVE